MKIESRTRRLGDEEAFDVLKTYSIPCVAGDTVTSIEDAVTTAERIGYPVALKIPDTGHHA